MHGPRLTTIQHVDNIIVLSKGEIIEQGKHQELLKNKGHYYSLYKLQYQKKVIKLEVVFNTVSFLLT